MKKRKSIALLTLFMLLFNMFSPYTVLFNNYVYAANADMAETDKPFVVKNIGSEELSDGSTMVTLEFAIASNVTNTGSDLCFYVDTNKIAPLDVEGEEESEDVDFIVNSTSYLRYGKSTIQKKTYEIVEEDGISKGKFRILMSQPSGGTDYETIMRSSKPYFVPGQSSDSYINGMTDYPVYYPFIRISFLIKDSSIDPNNLPANIIQLSPITGSLKTGAKYTYINSSGIASTLNVENFVYEGFAEGTEKTVKEVTVIQDPTDKIEHGNKIDLTGGKLHVVYDDNSEEDIDMTAEGVTIVDEKPANVDKPEISLNYKGKIVKTTLQITDPLVSFVKTTPITDSEYEQDESIDFTGLTFTATTKSGKTTTLTVTDITSSGPVIPNETQASVDSSNFTQSSVDENGVKKGLQTITFSYTKDDITKTATEIITVNDAIDTITVTKQPNKQVYKTGETLSLTGATAEVTFRSGGTPLTIAIPDGSASGYNSTLVRK